MRGLIAKDFLCLRKSALSYGIVLAIYIALTVTGLWDVSFFAAFMAMLVGMLPYSCFSYDHAAKWNLYALALPVSRRQIVLARYGTVLIAAVAAVAVVLVFSGVMALMLDSIEWEVCIVSATAALGFSLLLNAIMLPLLYRFGAERAKLVFFSVLGGLVLIVALIVNYNVMQPGGKAVFLDLTDAIASLGAFGMLGAVTVAGIVLLVISYLISVRIYERIEL